ncbi:MAG: hypothetical protein ACREEM_46480 [Blastocatellia bacterium]
MPESSARVEDVPVSAPFRAEKLSGELSGELSEKARKSPSGTGRQLPGFPKQRNLDWEYRKRRGNFEAWFVPDGAVRRDQKIYLGVIGKLKLTELDRMSDADRTAAIQAQVDAWKAKKEVRR